MQVLKGHTRPVSFVHFLQHQVVTSSIDGTLSWWNIGQSPEVSQSNSQHLGAEIHGPAQVLRCMKGHGNRKNFCGLSVREHDNLIACGSEAGQAYAYHTSWNAPLAHRFVCSKMPVPSHPGEQRAARQQGVDEEGVVCRGLVSAVAWRPVVADWPQTAILAAASSDGDLGLLSLEILEGDESRE